jgi:hypothetical protein
MSEHSTYSIWSRRDPNLRAGDAEREEFAERLRRGHADGRLTTDEFQERIGRCYSAKTIGELDRLAVDLPAERPGSSRVPARRLWLAPLVPLLVAAFVVSSALSWHHGGGGFWVIFPLLFVLRMMFCGRYRRWGMRRI